MRGTRDIDETTTANDNEGLDPREAARLLAQTKRDAKRQFNLSPPWITAFGGAVILVGYAALWLSTRGQHPYSGPSAGRLFVGPSASWLAAGIGLSIAVAGYAAATGKRLGHS